MYLADRRNYFVLDGKSSLDFGVWTNGYETFKGATRDTTGVIVPGGHGTLVNDNGRFENVDMIYRDCGIVREDALEHYRTLRAFLAVHSDAFYRLEDTYHPDEYRMAQFVGPLEPDIDDRYETALFDIAFICKPQHFLKSGEKWVENPSSLFNPTIFEAAPVIRIYGSGTLQVGSKTITIASHTLDHIDIDCDLGDAYCGSTNANRFVTMDDVPKLKPGTTNFVGTVTKYEIQPRWWEA